MVSLRERKVRPSYSLLAEGLQNLSDSESSVNGEDGQPVAGGSKKPVEDEQESLSSGDSSEFEPELASPKRKGGRNNDNVDPDLDSDETTSGTPTEDEDMEVDEDDDDEDIVHVRPSPGLGVQVETPKGQFRPQIPRRPIIFPRPVSGDGTTAFVQSDFNLIPLAYRNLIKEQAALISKPPSLPKTVDLERAREKDRTKTWGVEVFPSGPVTPYSTRLRKAVVGRERAEVELVKEEPNPVTRREKRRREAFQIARAVPLLAPWETYRGESWWPEIFKEEEAVAGTSKSKGKMRMRSEVRLGLDHVGIVGLDRMEFLNDLEAEPFLPTLLDIHGNPYTVCHMGIHDSQVPVPFEMFSWRRTDEFNPTKEGFVFSAGGPIWGLDWCPYPEHKAADFGCTQYLAVSPLPHIDTRPAMGEKWPKDTPGGIQIWSMLPPSSQDPASEHDKGSMRCEMVLCVDGGSAVELKWMPLGTWDDYEIEHLNPGTIPKLGILAAAQLDGSISLYSVPHPLILRALLGPEVQSSTRPLFVRLREPLLKLEVADAACTCLDWMTGTRLAVGLSNGHAAVWDVEHALKSGQKECLPSIYMTIALSSIRSVVAGRCPPSDITGKPKFDEDPFYLVLGAYDGTTTLVDLRDPLNPIELNRARTPTMAVGWSCQVVAPVYIDVDYAALMMKLRGSGAGRNYVITSHRGPVWDIAMSDFHSMIATAGSDGTLRISNAQTGFYRRRKMPLLTQTLYEMEYDMHTGEYRMLDNMIPETKQLELVSLRHATSSKKGQKIDENPQLVKSPNWPVQVGIHRVAWNNGGIGRAGLLASGTASGLGRVDYVRGRFRGGVKPVITKEA